MSVLTLLVGMTLAIVILWAVNAYLPQPLRMILTVVVIVGLLVVLLAYWVRRRARSVGCREGATRRGCWGGRRVTEVDIVFLFVVPRMGAVAGYFVVSRALQRLVQPTQRLLYRLGAARTSFRHWGPRLR
jgi:hypothetical protein